MQFSSLASFAQRVKLGRPLPFNVYNADQTLLLARGQSVGGADQLQALMSRGSLVDLAEMQSASERVRHAPRGALPALWSEYLGQLADTLRNADDAHFAAALDSSATAVMALVARDPDLAIIQVLRQEGNAHVQYGINHSLHTAITSQLIATRLSWPEPEAQLVFRVALTMNLGMLELQGQLAEQTTPPTAAQRAQIQAHPELSRMMLVQAGISNERWLDAVAQHHERPDGGGYPHGLREPCDLAELVRRADIYTAKLSPRRTRHAMAADTAGRQMFAQDPGHPMTAALIKEFGVYPPGSWVRLSTGEQGFVVRRGATVMAPEVMVTHTSRGTPLPRPTRRDTAQPGHAVQSLMEGTGTQPRLSAELMLRVAVS